jgi:transcription initiation factor IIE alpha subunit
MQRSLVAYLRTCGAFGATDEEMQLALGMNPNTQRPRRRELEDAGLIVRDGTRKTNSRRNADVWRLALQDGKKARECIHATRRTDER